MMGSTSVDVNSVAAAYGVNIRSRVFCCMADLTYDFRNPLPPKPISGRTLKVSAEEIRWLALAVKDHTALQFKFLFNFWKLSLIAVLIEREFGKILMLASVSRIMKLLGFSAQKPLRRARQQAAIFVRNWKTGLYPAIRSEAKAYGAMNYFAAKSCIRSYCHAGPAWSSVGETPLEEVTGRHFSLIIISAVSPQGEFRFVRHDGVDNAAVFREFLKRLLIGATWPLFLIVDGHTIHKAKLVMEYIATQDGSLKLFYLLPYSSQLNADEQAQAQVKSKVSRLRSQPKGEMKRVALGILRRIEALLELVKSFFCQPERQCAAI